MQKNYSMAYKDPSKQKAWRDAHKEEQAVKAKEYREARKEDLKRYRDEHKQQRQEWRALNKEKIAVYTAKYNKQYTKRRLKEDSYFRLKYNLRNRMGLALKNGFKAVATEELLGCSFEEVRLHLTKLMQPGMTWENYGPRTWHIDHIIPVDAFDLTKPEQQHKCFHYSNLQPLWAVDNLKKSNKI